MATDKPNLVSKLAAIRRAIPNIEKEGKNAHFGYSYMMAEDVAGKLGDALSAVNIVVAKENLSVDTRVLDKGGVLNIVTLDFIFCDGDSGEHLRVASAGAGYDATDKGIYKALTGALKYALTQTLVMRVGHIDPEDDSDPIRDNGKPPNVEVSTEGERSILETKAAIKHGGAQKAKAWILRRCIDLGVDDYKKLPKVLLDQLMTEAMASDKSGRVTEHVIPTATGPDKEIGF